MYRCIGRSSRRAEMSPSRAGFRWAGAGNGFTGAALAHLLRVFADRLLRHSEPQALLLRGWEGHGAMTLVTSTRCCSSAASRARR